MPKGWIQEQMDASWRFRWGVRWECFKDWLCFWCWTWPTNGLVWDFSEDEPRLMYARTKERLAADDPRHYGD